MPKLSTEEIYAKVTGDILAALEKGTVPWQKPWIGNYTYPRNLSGRPYKGINSVLLSLAPYTDPRWMTFNQIRQLKGVNLRKSEKATLVVLWKFLKVKAEIDSDEEKIIPMLRHFFVFNVEQCDLEPDAEVKPWKPPRANPDALAVIDVAEAVWDNWEERGDAPERRFNGNRAAYDPLVDRILLPPRNTFKTASGFYMTEWHESIHATGHPRRLDRFKPTAFGSEAYSREELIAEMGAAFIGGYVGLQGEIKNSAAYIKGWLKALQNDPKMVLLAAGKAQRAADRILGVSAEGE